MPSLLASKLDKLEAEISPPSKMNVIVSLITDEEIQALRSDPNVTAQGESWIVTITEDDG